MQARKTSMQQSQMVEAQFDTVHPDTQIYHFYLFDQSTGMNDLYDDETTWFEFFRGEVAFLIKEDSFSQHFSVYTISDQLKTIFERNSDSKVQYSKTSMCGRPYMAGLNLSDIKKVNAKIN